jgi:imidazole glycerol-phosphate synthase subunit HisH
MSTHRNVAIIDYQMSNLFSVEHACEHVRLQAKVTSSKDELLHADAAILPGVGAFGDAMRNLNRLGLSEAIHTFIASGKPFLGVCLGLQLLFTESEEFGTHKGLGIVGGQVKKFPAINSAGIKIRVPQISWNTIAQPHSGTWAQTPLRRLSNNTFVYFVHSYYVVPNDPSVIASETEYEGITYCSSITQGNIFACQFHPEKSGPDGIKVYEDWAKEIHI